MNRAAESASKPFRPLASRLVAGVAAVCAVCAVIAMVMQGWQVWHDAEEAFANAGRDMAASRVPLLATALWDIEAQAVERQLDDIARHPQVAGVELTTAGGQTFVAGRHAPSAQADVEWVVPHPKPGGAALGRVRIDIERSYLRAQLVRALLHTALAIALLTTLTCVLLVRFLKRELSEPLRSIADYTQRLTPGALGQPLELARPAHPWHDDIDLVAHGFHTLHHGIVRYVGERDRAVEELARERDHLDTVVRQRTADLVRVNQFLESTSQLTAQLLYLPLDDYPGALRAALGDTARMLGAHACGLAERDALGHWQWRLAAGRGPVALEGRQLPPLARAGGWRMERATRLSASPDLAALLRWADAESVLVCRHEAADSGHLLACFDGAGHELGDTSERRVELVAKALFGALARWRDLQDLEKAREQLMRESRSDALTGLANRRAFDERKLDELRRARRLRQPLTLLMVDIDHFKRFNDHYGHAAGDDCLIKVARCLSALYQRPGECVARLGGEEFAVLLPHTTAELAAQRGERVREAVQSLNIAHAAAPVGQVSVSVGVATATDHDGQEPTSARFERLMRLADEALYAAKARGRNAVVARIVS